MARWRTALLLCLLCLDFGAARAQVSSEPGRSIGKVSTHGKLIVVELNEGALGKAHLFDLTGRTLRFTPQPSGYKVENGPLRWDPNFGPQLAGARATLHNFAFPFAGQSWSTFLVGTSGSIRFGAQERVKTDPYGHAEAGIVLDRFDQLADVAAGLIETAPAISVLLKPRLSGPRYLKELPDRAVITWDLTEPYGSLLDFTWFKTANRFQAVIHRDGSIDMSYEEIAAKDAIVGVFPTPGDPAAAVRFSSVSPHDGPFPAPYEAFHYLARPKPQDLSCTVIRALGDRFDFLAYYSDFRVDTQEASPPSDGPVGGKVSGIGDTMHDQSPQILQSRCTKGRFQLGYAEPVFVGANEMQKRPPPEAAAANSHEIAFYTPQLAGSSLGRQALPYNYAIGHLGHEVGHRWSAYATAKVNGKTIRLGPWPHWAPGLQAPVAFPYSLPLEASTLGGGVWQDNVDGTYTQLRDGYFVPASGYSYLDLYLMGLASPAEVPGFFILDNLVRIGSDVDGHAIFKANRVNVTIRDVIAAEGPRLPGVHVSQRRFNTGIVVVVERGRRPSAALLTQAEGVRRRWIDYWRIATGHRAAMTTDPR